MGVKNTMKRKLDSKEKVTKKKAKVVKKPEPESESESSDLESSANELSESEDELDQSSGDELDNDDEVEEAEGEEEEGDAENGSADKSAGRAEQKRVREERKLARPLGNQIQQIKQVWERLRVKKDTPGPVRQKLINEAWELIKGNVKEMVFKHDASRVVQTVFKYCDKEKKQAITAALKGSYVELAKSPYGKFLLIKIMHYGNTSVRADVIDELHGNFAKLMKHKEGAYVIEDIYRQYSTAAQKRQIMREFYGSEYVLFKDQDKDKKLADILQEHPEKRHFIMRNLTRVITSAVNKGSIGFNLIHAAMLEYVNNIDGETEREGFVDLVTEQLPEIVHTPEGAMVAAKVIAIATAKERKNVIKALKPFASKCAEDEYGYFVLLTLFNTVDDTVLVGRSLHQDIKANITKLMKSKMGRRPLIYLLVGRSPRYFPKPVQDKFAIIDELKQNTSKKDDESRQLELNKAFAPLLVEAIAENAQELLADTLGAQFISEALLYAHDTDRTAAVEAVLEVIGGDIDDEHPVKQNPFIGRTLRSLVQGGTWNAKEGRIVPSPEPSLDFASKLAPIILPNIEAWANGDSAFAIVALLESDQKEATQKALRPFKKSLDSENKASKLILELL